MATTATVTPSTTTMMSWVSSSVKHKPMLHTKTLNMLVRKCDKQLEGNFTAGEVTFLYDCTCHLQLFKADISYYQFSRWVCLCAGQSLTIRIGSQMVCVSVWVAVVPLPGLSSGSAFVQMKVGDGSICLVLLFSVSKENKILY